MQVHETAAFSFRQSRFFPRVPESPVRGIIVAPSGGGKTTLLVDLLVRLYAGVYNRIYVFSPNAHADVANVWAPVEEFCKNTLRQEEPCLYDDWDEKTISSLIEKHKRIMSLCVAAKRKERFQCCFVFDDWADDENLQRHSPALKWLFVKGRHIGASTWVSLQKFRMTSQVVRVKASALLVFKLRSAVELQCIAEENSAAYGQRTTEELIKKATADKYSFLYINTTATDPHDMFWLRFEARLVPRRRSAGSL